MNALVFFASVVLIGLIAWILLERFMPERARGWKTWALNIIGGLPVLGPELVSLLMQYDIERFVTPDKLPWYFGAMIVLNLFARARTSTPLGGGRQPSYDPYEDLK